MLIAAATKGAGFMQIDRLAAMASVRIALSAARLTKPVQAILNVTFDDVGRHEHYVQKVNVRCAVDIPASLIVKRIEHAAQAEDHVRGNINGRERYHAKKKCFPGRAEADSCIR
jgi:hypothetical protein